MHDYKNNKSRFEKISLSSFLFFIIIVLIIFGSSGCAGKTGYGAENAAIALKSGSKDVNAAENGKASEAKAQTVIVIDPGHGSRINKGGEPISPESKELKPKNTIGATGIYTKTPEYKIAMDTALKLEKILESRGYMVIMTKNSIDENPTNIERAEVGNKNNAALVIRIHADSSTNSNVKGASVLIPSGINERTKKIKDESEGCAKAIIKKMVDEAGVRGRGIIERKDLTGFNWSKVPVVLVEMGFLSNKQEDIALNNEQNQNKIADAIADGIDEYFKGRADFKGNI